jgi:sulfotransferase family protein
MRSAHSRRLKKLVRHPLRTTRPVQHGLALASAFKLKFVPSGPYVFLACMPRTASTFLSEALCELTGFKRVELADAYAENEQELDVPRLLDAYSYGSVTQQHVVANRRTIELMQRYSIRPVVLVRNVFDIVVSIRDFLYTEGCGKWPTFFCTDESFQALDDATQLEQIVELGLPWYFDFFVSWQEATRRQALDTLWITYEDAVADWEETMARIARFYGIEQDEEAIARALERTRARARSLRLNKGTSGRGETALHESARRRIEQYARFYPGVDFSLIGLGPRESE